MSRRLTLLLALLLAACTTVAPPPTQPNDREWNLISADYAWLESMRKAQAVAPAGSSRKQQIEAALESHRKIKPTLDAFITKVDEYYNRTHDPRAAQVIAREKIIVGDEYITLLSRYDSALEQYRAALAIDPNNPDAQKRIELAQARRFVSMNAFAAIKTNMKEDEVRRSLGLPREDWIKQVVQNNRLYSVWIYPKEDGGAAAVYFDNGVVYHTNWNAAAPAAAQTK
jgi:tetratricopeptide (TPR) repeat protein